MMIYPVAQIFTSPQGEGRHAGVLMKFIRLAGCNVGRYEDKDLTPELKQLRVLHPAHSICTSALGDSFLCDTDYHMVAKMTAEEIMRCPRPLNATGPFAGFFNHVCITGGEPLMHDLQRLVMVILAYSCTPHLETSGTKPIPQFFKDWPIWVTCSPKDGFLGYNREFVREWKFVIPSGSDVAITRERIWRIVHDSNAPVYIQPINGVKTLDPQSVETVLELQRCDPRFIISQQLHKLLGVE